MGKKPGNYSDIGQKATDLLYKDYAHQPPIHYHYRWFDWSFHFLFKLNKIIPGLNAGCRLVIPYQRSNRMELQYLHDYAGITTGISISKNPILNFSGVFGNSLLCLGTDISFDTKTAKLTKCDAGVNLNTSMLNASLTLVDKGTTLNASSYLSIDWLNRTALAAEIIHRFLNNQTAITIGAQIYLSPSTLVKARAGIDGNVGALFQLELFRAFFLTIAGELNAKAAMSSAKMGLSFALKY